MRKIEGHGDEVHVCVPSNAAGKQLFAVVDVETGETAYVVTAWIKRSAGSRAKDPMNPLAAALARRDALPA